MREHIFIKTILQVNQKQIKYLLALLIYTLECGLEVALEKHEICAGCALKSTERNNMYAWEAQKVQIAGSENLAKIIKDSSGVLMVLSHAY